MALKMETVHTRTTVAAGRGVTFPLGFKAAAVRAGLKAKNLDLIIIKCDWPASAAGVFTTNLVQAACVVHSRKVVSAGAAQAIFCNAGNANACTGPQGEADNKRCADLVAAELGIDRQAVLVASTGMIGNLMPMEKIEAAVPLAIHSLDSSPQTDVLVSRAILTTDTRPKSLAVELRSEHWPGPIRIGGIAKGSGMIAPNMATTLGFITTDAKIEPLLLQSMLWKAIEKSFNRVTVDGDTSTNDMVLLLANGASGCEVLAGHGLDEFQAALDQVCLHLAKEVVRDGEGATKLVAVRVHGTGTDQHAARVAKTIAESPLVKTALFGCDPNWGRILAAAGRAGVPFRPEESSAWIGTIPVCSNGAGRSFDSRAAHAYLQRKEIEITVQLGSGPGEATFWTCDYSYDYIKINADYHT